MALQHSAGIPSLAAIQWNDEVAENANMVPPSFVASEWLVTFAKLVEFSGFPPF